MQRRIRPFEPADRARVLEICLIAFRPIHAGFEAALGPALFRRSYAGWEERYAETIAAFPPVDAATSVHVVEEAARVVAFVSSSLHADRQLGEIGLNAVDPACQHRGIGRMMYAFVLADLAARGARAAYVSTGGDEAHAPARAAYAAVGFDRAVPSVHYFQTL